MSDLPKLTQLRLSQGVWEGLLSGAGSEAPALMVHHGDERLTPPELEAQEGGGWLVRFHVPTDVISDGMQVITVSLEEPREKLASFAIIAGDALRDDIRAEVALLRAELDMLKRAFRRHCNES